MAGVAGRRRDPAFGVFAGAVRAALPVPQTQEREQSADDKRDDAEYDIAFGPAVEQDGTVPGQYDRAARCGVLLQQGSDAACQKQTDGRKCSTAAKLLFPAELTGAAEDLLHSVIDRCGYGAALPSTKLRGDLLFALSVS